MIFWRIPLSLYVLLLSPGAGASKFVKLVNYVIFEKT